MLKCNFFNCNKMRPMMVNAKRNTQHGVIRHYNVVLDGVLRLFVVHENTKGCIGIKLQAFGLNSGRQISCSYFFLTHKLDDSTERYLGQVTANISSTGSFFFRLFV